MVYLLFDPLTKLYKIGFTHQGIKTRIRQIRKTYPRIQFISKFWGGCKDEKRVHFLFETKRMHNEWFVLSENDVQLFGTLTADKLDVQL